MILEVLSCTKVLTTNQKVVMEQYYSPSKNVKFEKYYNPEDKIPKVQSIIYYASDGIKFLKIIIHYYHLR